VSESPEWKEFEALVERIQRQLRPDASITRNERLLGQNSGIERQIDICIRYTLAGTPLLIVLECKKLGRPVSIADLEALICVKADVNAHAGIMVSEKGFSNNLNELAVRNNIQLFTLFDTQRADWDCRIRVPICIEDWFLVPILFQSVTHGSEPQDLPERIILNGARLRLAVLVKELWDQEPNRKPGIASYSSDLGPDNKLNVAFKAEVERYVRTAWLSLVGLTNVTDDLTYAGEAWVTMTDEPPQFHTHEMMVPPHESSPHAIPVRCIAVNGREIDLRQPSVIVKLKLGGKDKPLCYPSLTEQARRTSR
jgi:hypothetical protein